MMISVAIIVKNEESVIERCISCVSHLADEIVIVDTGSTDKTKELASVHPKVRLFDSELFNADTPIKDFSFSLAKNEAIRKCRGEWVIWFDADDFIDEENAKRIRNIAEETKETCLFSFTIAYGTMRFEHCRLFTNGAEIFFDEAHSCHEYLNTLGLPNYARRDVMIQHLPVKRKIESQDRNILILESDYARGVHDSRTLFYMANSYRECGRHKDAVEFYDKYLQVSKWKEERFFARYFKAKSHRNLGDLENSRVEAILSLAEDFRFAESYCLLGDLAFELEDYERAQAWFIMAVKTPFPSDSKLFVSQQYYSSYPGSRINDCHVKLVGDDKSLVDFKDKVKSKSGESRGNFILPQNDEEMKIAASSLIALCEIVGGYVGIVSENGFTKSLISKVDSFIESKADDAIRIELPMNLKGCTPIEWYCRAAGYVTDDWSQIIAKATEIRESFNAD